jgi:hypothetical protein
MDSKSLNIAFNKLGKWIQPFISLVHKNDVFAKCQELTPSSSGARFAKTKHHYSRFSCINNMKIFHLPAVHVGVQAGREFVTVYCIFSSCSKLKADGRSGIRPSDFKVDGDLWKFLVK